MILSYAKCHFLYVREAQYISRGSYLGILLERMPNHSLWYAVNLLYGVLSIHSIQTNNDFEYTLIKNMGDYSSNLFDIQIIVLLPYV